MFEPPAAFDPEAKLALVVLNGNDSSVKIGRKTYRGFDLTNHAGHKVVRLVETTYKHYKGYVSGALIDTIQTLATHCKAARDFGIDEDGDVYWAVEFRVSDFEHMVKGIKQEDQNEPTI